MLTAVATGVEPAAEVLPDPLAEIQTPNGEIAKGERVSEKTPVVCANGEK